MKVNEETKYPIYIGTGVIPQFGKLFKEHLQGYSTVLLVTDPVIEKLHGQKVFESFENSKIKLNIEIIPEGERFKSRWGLEMLYEIFIEHELDRRSVIIAMGGGVIGDLAGFAAATYMRGISLVQIPTTLLAQVDSSLGGKTAINYLGIKNLIGRFYHPQLILTDVSFLQTLDERRIKSGLAEVLKYGVIMDAGLFDYIEDNVDSLLKQDSDIWEYIVVKCCEHKISVVEEDAEERTDVRAILNYGHTVGHAIESLGRFKYLHGEASAIGMVAAARIAVDMGILDNAMQERQSNLLSEIGLPIQASGIEIDPLIERMYHDKKRVDDILRFILPTEIGNVKIKSVPEEQIRRSVAAVID
jgi:3-dehydroquinate synthase